MRTPIPRRLALGAAAIVLLLWPGIARAQEGAPSGPPVTDPRTNDNKVNEARPITDSPPPETTNLLPPIPATAHDPAPPGTRGVRVDLPPGVVAPAQAPATAPARRAARPIAGIHTMEGVVTRVSAPGTDLPEERLRITLDPSQDWESYVMHGPVGLAHHEGSNARSGANRTQNPPPPPAPAPSREETRRSEAARPGAIDLVVTHRTFIFTFARSPEGYDLFGVDNPSAPDRQVSRTGQTLRPVAPTLEGPKPASFANIREGSFVAVRFHKDGNVNDVLNLSLIELPTIPASRVPVPGAPAAAPGAAAPAPAPATVPAQPPRQPALAPPPSTALPPAPVRVPVVPVTPAPPSLGPR